MKPWTGVLIVTAVLAAAASPAAQPLTADERQALKTRIEQRYDVVPLTGGVALRPKSPRGDLRLIEVSDTIVVNGVPVSGRELRDRVGADADAILRLSYLDADARRALFEPPTAESPERPQAEPPQPPMRDDRPVRGRRSHGDRVRVFGDVVVPEDEAITGQAVAVMGDVRIDGEVGEQVVAVLGSVELGPRAVVRGDVVTVGGHLRRQSGARVHGGVTEVALGDPGVWINVEPWFDGWGPVRLWGFGPVTRLMGSAFRFLFLLLIASVALVIARRGVEDSAHRIADNPVKATLVGLAAWMLFLPVFVLVEIVLTLTIIGIPLAVVLVPMVMLVMLLMSVVGFSGTAVAVGQWLRRRAGLGAVPAFADVCLGLVMILLPVLLARVLAFGGWPLRPVVFLLLMLGIGVESLAWASGFGAVLSNTLARWGAARSARMSPLP